MKYKNEIYLFIFAALRCSPPHPERAWNNPSAVGSWGAAVSGHNDVSGISIPSNTAWHLPLPTGDQPPIQQGGKKKKKDSFKT